MSLNTICENKTPEKFSIFTIFSKDGQQRKDAHQTMLMHRLVCTFGVGMQQSQVFM